MEVEFSLEVNQNPSEAEVEVSRVMALWKKKIQQVLLYYRELQVEHCNLDKYRNIAT